MATPSNGNLSRSTLTVAPGFDPYPARFNFRAVSVDTWSNLLLAAIITDWLNLRAAFKEAFGVDLTYAEAYRDLGVQQWRWDEHQLGGPLAANVGGSNHGWGLCLDLRNQVGTKGSPQSNWMIANAGRFGFVRDVSSEYWHYHHLATFSVTKPTTATASTGSKPLVPAAPFTASTLLGDDMFAAQIYTTSKRGPVPAGAKFILDIRGKVVKRIDTAAKLTAAQKKTLQDEWNTLVAVQPNKEPIHWSGDNAWAYYDGGYKRLYW